MLIGACLAVAPAAAAPEFAGERAMALLEAQCALGPRHPGSPGIVALRRMISALADSAGLPAVSLCFTTADPLGDGDLEACNIIVSAGPAGGERLWLGAHYDTRPIADRDPDPQRRSEPLPGANDGASGVAVLLHLIELFAEAPPPQGVDLIFFDAEDSGRAGEVATFCLGSQHLARTWRDFGSPLSAGEPRGLVLLDMVGERDLRIPMERYSLAHAAAWTQAIFERAGRLGLTAFDPVPGRAVIDDHVPFLNAGIPAVNLIDFEFPEWHTLADTPAVCSAASLEQVGRLLVDLVYRP
jgi:hypothetical protein